MNKRNRARKVYGKWAHYWREEMMPLLVAAACVDIAVKHSKDASVIYQQVIDAWDRPDCQALLKDNIALPIAEIKAWEKVKSVLSKPKVLLTGIRKQTEAEQTQVESGTIDQEIKALNRKLKQYSGQERRLMQAFKLGFTPDVILDEMNQTKKEKEADQARLAALIQTKENIARMGDYEAKLKELCARIAPDLDYCTNQDKKDAYTYLDLKVTATPEGVDIKGYLDSSVVSADSCLLTTGQTSGCLFLCTYDWPSGEEAVSIIPVH